VVVDEPRGRFSRGCKRIRLFNGVGVQCRVCIFSLTHDFEFVVLLSFLSVQRDEVIFQLDPISIIVTCPVYFVFVFDPLSTFVGVDRHLRVRVSASDR